MKKNIILLVILLSLLISFGCKKDAQTVAMQGIVNSIVGTVTLKRDDLSFRAQVDDLVVAGTTIVTGTKSIAFITFGQNVIKLSENTSFSIEKLESDLNSNTQQANFNLQNGEIFSKSNKKFARGDSFQMRTPTTVAAIRGTEFVVLERDGQSKVSCVSGKVAVANTTLGDNLRFVEVPANQEVQVVSGQPLVVTDISEEDRLRMESIFNDLRNMNFGARDEEPVEEIVETPVFVPEQEKPQVVRKAQPRRKPAPKPVAPAPIPQVEVEEEEKEEVAWTDIDTEEQETDSETLKLDIKRISIESAKVKL